MQRRGPQGARSPAGQGWPARKGEMPRAGWAWASSAGPGDFKQTGPGQGPRECTVLMCQARAGGATLCHAPSLRCRSATCHCSSKPTWYSSTQAPLAGALQVRNSAPLPAGAAFKSTGGEGGRSAQPAGPLYTTPCAAAAASPSKSSRAAGRRRAMTGAGFYVASRSGSVELSKRGECRCRRWWR